MWLLSPERLWHKECWKWKRQGERIPSFRVTWERGLGPLLKMTLRPYGSHFACTWHELGKDEHLRTSWKKAWTTIPKAYSNHPSSRILGWIKLMSHGKTTTLQCRWLIALSITSSVECFKKGIIPRMDEEGKLWYYMSSQQTALKSHAYQWLWGKSIWMSTLPNSGELRTGTRVFKLNLYNVWSTIYHY